MHQQQEVPQGSKQPPQRMERGRTRLLTGLEAVRHTWGTLADTDRRQFGVASGQLRRTTNKLNLNESMG